MSEIHNHYYINIMPTNKKDMAQIMQFLTPNKRQVSSIEPANNSNDMTRKKKKVVVKRKQEAVEQQSIVNTPTKCSVLTEDMDNFITPSMFTQSPDIK